MGVSGRLDATDFLTAMSMSDDDWEAAEAERDGQRMHNEFVSKWMPAWRHFGVTQPGFEHYLIQKES